MTLRFLADMDLRFSIVRGIRLREPSVDLLAANDVIPESMPDSEVLALAANLGRILISHDRKTMPKHFYRFLDRSSSPGLILIPQACPIRQAIDDIIVLWERQTAEELRNQIRYLPF